MPASQGGRRQSNNANRHRLLPTVEKRIAAISNLLKRRLSDATSGQTLTVNFLRELREGLEELVSFIPAIGLMEREEQDRAERRFLELVADLEVACKTHEWQLHGSWPTFYVDYGITLELDERKRTASVGGKRLATVSVDAIVTALEPLVRELIPKNFDSATFMADLAAAYDEARSGRAGQVPVFDVYRAFVLRSQGSRFWRDARAEAFLGLSADQFRARLSRALKENATSDQDGRELRLIPPLNPKDGLFTYQPAESRFAFVGRIEFVSVEGSVE